jgi:hypothetical protein
VSFEFNVPGFEFGPANSKPERKLNGSCSTEIRCEAERGEAQAYIAELNRKVIQRWQERVTNGPFMSKFLEENLPVPAVKLFFKNWGNFTVEINTLASVSYHKHIGFLKRSRER